MVTSVASAPLTPVTNGKQPRKADPSIVNDELDLARELAKDIGTDPNFKRQIVWPNTIGFIVFHVLGVFATWMFFTGAFHPLTYIYGYTLGSAAGLGVTMGAHRYFTHKAFKCNTFVRRTLLVLFTMAGQNSLLEWVRDHRQHHKYSDTDADPHNATRGFFFSHMGWLMSRKHPKVIEYGKRIDMSDLLADPVLVFQKKYFLHLYGIFTVISLAIPCYCWDESLYYSFFAVFVMRNLLTLHSAWCVNSVAHLFGNKPFDRSIRPTDAGAWVFMGMGEGWHNYHHTFPNDYKAAELGAPFNFTRKVIEFCARRGWIYDLRQVPPEMVARRMARTGDGSPGYNRSLH